MTTATVDQLTAELTGQCRWYAGERNKCQMGLTPRRTTGGPREGWLLRMPCRRRKWSQDIAHCEHYLPIDAREIDRRIRLREASNQSVLHALVWLARLKCYGKREGSETCPLCGSELTYSIDNYGRQARFRRLTAKCPTDGCIDVRQ